MTTRHKAVVELPLGFGDQPLPELYFGLESESLPEEFSDGDVSDGESDLDVEMTEDLRGSHQLGEQLGLIPLKQCSSVDEGCCLPSRQVGLLCQSRLLSGYWKGEERLATQMQCN